MPLKQTPELASLYVVEFDQGTIKIGYSTNPELRMQNFASHGAVFRIRVLRHWVSEPHMGACLNEKTLIEWCRKRAVEVSGKEWFYGLEFDEVKKAIQQMVASDGYLPL
jgi:predicted GIY-YIG superfamily endonuclease